jgi:CRISPR/Cas system CMR subunit Cmr6 (Cas7 group RAMP superfamily)
MTDPPRPAPRPDPQPGRRATPPRTPPRAEDQIRAAGPFGSVITLVREKRQERETYRLDGSAPLDSGSNALIVLNRIAFFDQSVGTLHDGGKRALLRWACGNRLGQQDKLVAAVAARRVAALRALSGGSGPLHVARLRAQPEWRLAVGLGNNANAHEIGLALHGTYGWPVIPGSALKGLAAAWAVTAASAADVWRVLGGPRTDVPDPDAGPRDRPSAARGTVCFLDAIPAGAPVTVEADVLTPHVKPYYDGTATGHPVPPAEYHNPVPLTFLSVRGAYAVDLYGTTSEDVDLAAEWLTKAGDEFGAGAKTAAGYGYLSVSREEPG